MTKYIALNSPDGDRPIKIVSKLEKAIELCLKYKAKRDGEDIYYHKWGAVGKIFVPKLVVDEEKKEYYWTDDGEKLPKEGEYYFVIDGIGYYPGNDYPIIKPDGWFHYTDINRIKDLESLMRCCLTKDGTFTLPSFSSRTYKKKGLQSMYVREVLKVDKGKIE